MFDRISLGGSPIEYSKVDFLSLVDAMHLYKIINGQVTPVSNMFPDRLACISGNMATTEWTDLMVRTMIHSCGKGRQFCLILIIPPHLAQRRVPPWQGDIKHSQSAGRNNTRCLLHRSCCIVTNLYPNISGMM